MNPVVTLQGRELTRADIDFVRQLIAEHPAWSRRQLSIALSTAWQWRNAKGVLKDMACRSLLVKLNERDQIKLPARRQTPTSRMVKRDRPDIAHDTALIDKSLKALRPLSVIDVHCHKDYEPLYSCLLSRYHYLDYTSSVGENMKYFVVDRVGRPLACSFHHQQHTFSYIPLGQGPAAGESHISADRSSYFSRLGIALWAQRVPVGDLC